MGVEPKTGTFRKVFRARKFGDEATTGLGQREARAGPSNRQRARGG